VASVIAHAPFSTARRTAGVEITGLADADEVRLFTVEEYDAPVWAAKGARNV
jgi:hypothetical protein